MCTASTPPWANNRRASSSGGRSPTISRSARYRSCPMPVRLRFRSKRTTSSRPPDFSVTVMGWPMAAAPYCKDDSAHSRPRAQLMATEVVEVEGHIIDSLILAKVLDTIVDAGADGVRGQRLERPCGANPFEFMASEVSSEKPKELLVAEVADRIKARKAEGGKILAVCGPAVIHTGAGPDLARLVRHGWVDTLFAGNGFATHDIESNVLGTSLGVLLREGRPIEHGHANHLRVINEVRRRGSIAASVDDGYIP